MLGFEPERVLEPHPLALPPKTRSFFAVLVPVLFPQFLCRNDRVTVSHGLQRLARRRESGVAELRYEHFDLQS